MVVFSTYLALFIALCAVGAGISKILRNQESIMATAAQIQAQLDATNAKLDGIQTDITSLKQQIADLLAGGSATAAELQALLDSATALAVKAGALDDQTT